VISAGAPSADLPARGGETAPSSVQARPADPAEACPLCGAALAREQEWCLSCGAAARTRVAPAPSWRAPIVLASVLVLVFLGVLAGALVKLAYGSVARPAPLTRVMTSAPAGAPATAGAGATRAR